ncbi:tetratricopeptide repeat protein [Kitasatospora sp. MAP5-34]|uniref:tetratricopeptide repeat protein n=1 Tax=Kitasatospora sp. MAP5-34 TaxID=3035102 RepID=UPI0024737EEC|nr:tetratricopeptide repeat protein [Kitasatospora sp. MAP5-34]MDH6580786.1 DNA-binding SARP family transcriptional activator [Kitasatospora sp. MAP5-34]
MTSALERLRRLLRAAGAAALLAALLAGLPYALLHYAQMFRPQHLPSLDEITTWASNPLSEVLLLQLLYCLCWALWAYLLLQTLRELGWHVVHFGALLSEAGPDAVAFTARRTIAGLLVGAIVLAIATSLRSTPAHRATMTLAGWSSPIAATAPAVPQATAPRTHNAVRTPAISRTQSTGTCTVRPGDTLWDLADRHLDNPLRWEEIYELNKLLPQPDGRHLSDPDRIYPGWTMLLPAAHPQQSTTTPAPPATPDRPPATSTVTPAPAPRPVPLTAAPSAEAVPPTSGSRPTAEPTPAATPQETSDPGIQLPRDAGYLALAVAAALSAAAVRRTLRRRRDYRPGDPSSQHQPRPEETPLVAALRGITRLHPAASTGPAEPGTPHNDLPLAVRGAQQQGLLDLLAGQQHPRLTLVGPGADEAARALLATALTTPIRARLLLPRTEATRLAPGLTGRQLAPCRLAADLEEALGVLEEELLRRARHQDAPPAADRQPPEPLVLLARHDPRHHQRLSALLKAGRTHGLAALLLTDTMPTHTDGLTYRVEANGNATAHGTPPGDRLRIFHLPVSSADILLSLIPECDEGLPDDTSLTIYPASPARPSTEKGESGPLAVQVLPPILSGVSDDFQGDENPLLEAEGEAAWENSEKSELVGESVLAQPAPLLVSALRPDGLGESGRTQEATVARSGGAVATLAAPRPVCVSLLGPLTITVQGQVVTRGLAGYSGELLAYLASHPAGSTKDAILEAIWPEKDPGSSGTEAFHTAKKSVRGALRTALGATTSLSVFLHAGGLWRLDPALVEIDLDGFHDAARRAAATDPAERLAAHRRTAELYHGELCEGLDRAWLTAPREDARRRALNALGTLATGAEDPEEAVGLLERALEHDPYNEQLHLRLARLHTALGRPEAVRRTQERLHRKLTEIDERPTATTTRAFQDLLNPNPATTRPILGRPTPQRPNPAAPNHQTRP